MDRRAYERVDLDAPAVVMAAGSERHGRLLNISEGGLALSLPGDAGRALGPIQEGRVVIELKSERSIEQGFWAVWKRPSPDEVTLGVAFKEQLSGGISSVSTVTRVVVWL